MWPLHIRRTFSGATLGGLPAPFFKNILEQGSPFVKNFLKPQVLSMSPGKLKIKIPFRDEFIGNIGTPCLHGGTLSAAIDHCGGFCAWSVLTESKKTVSTVDLRVDFLLPSLCEELICEAHVAHRGGKLIRVDVACWNETETKKVALGRLAFNVYESSWHPEEVFKHLLPENMTSDK